MARRRMIDPEFFLDEEISKVTPHARLLYIGLWGIADDNVFTIPNRPEWIKAQIFPYENVDINSLLTELVKLGKLLSFQYDGEEYKAGKYYFLKNMHKHQRVEKPSLQKYPSHTTPLLLPYQLGSPRSKEKISKEKISKTHYPFNKIWAKYPNKVGMKAAEKHFNASVKTDQDWVDINKALDNYLKSERIAKGYIQDGSRFFNNWRDWIDYTETMCLKCNGRGRYTNECGYNINCICPAGLRRKDNPIKEEQF